MGPLWSQRLNCETVPNKRLNGRDVYFISQTFTHSTKILEGNLSCGHIILLKELILKGVDVNSKNDVNGWTALHWAAYRNNVEAVKLLLNSGACINRLTSNGKRASSLSTNDEIRLLLWRDDPSKIIVGLPIMPNYLRNPPLCCQNVSSKRAINICGTPTYTENELVLKVRIAESLDPDFIEVELSELTFENLKETCCQELEIEPAVVLKIRQLPNSVIRNDKDVKRLKEFDEIEIVKAKL